MKEYPSTSQSFKVNGKKHTMKKFTLGLQSRIEDENIEVTIKEVLECCTDMSEDEIMGLDADQFNAIYTDIRDFTYDIEPKGDGESKKPSS